MTDPIYLHLPKCRSGYKTRTTTFNITFVTFNSLPNDKLKAITADNLNAAEVIEFCL